MVLRKILWLLLLLCSFDACGPSHPSAVASNTAQLPSLSVMGFSCELGGKNCQNRAVGRQMRDFVIKDFLSSGKFREASEEPGELKHILDVTDMLWTSGESSLLADLDKIGHSDYLAYGRVIEFDSTSHQLKVELTVEQRKSGAKLVVEGVGEHGSLELAVNNAVQHFDEK